LSSNISPINYDFAIDHFQNQLNNHDNSCLVLLCSFADLAEGCGVLRLLECFFCSVTIVFVPATHTKMFALKFGAMVKELLGTNQSLGPSSFSSKTSILFSSPTKQKFSFITSLVHGFILEHHVPVVVWNCPIPF